MERRRESGVKPIEIAENWLQRFHMEGGVKKHLTKEVNGAKLGARVSLARVPLKAWHIQSLLRLKTRPTPQTQNTSPKTRIFILSGTVKLQKWRNWPGPV